VDDNRSVCGGSDNQITAALATNYLIWCITLPVHRNGISRMHDWDEVTPIYLQLRSTVVRRILSGSLPEGEAVPSVRQVAAEEKINPLTISRAYQLLVDEGLLEKRRGLGMFVCAGARELALVQERQVFLSEEWPRVRRRIGDLGLDVQELLKENG